MSFSLNGTSSLCARWRVKSWVQGSLDACGAYQSKLKNMPLSWTEHPICFSYHISQTALFAVLSIAFKGRCYNAFSHPSPNHLPSYTFASSMGPTWDPSPHKREEMVWRWVGECKKAFPAFKCHLKFFLLFSIMVDLKLAFESYKLCLWGATCCA